MRNERGREERRAKEREKGKIKREEKRGRGEGQSYRDVGGENRNVVFLCVFLLVCYGCDLSLVGKRGARRDWLFLLPSLLLLCDFVIYKMIYLYMRYILAGRSMAVNHGDVYTYVGESPLVWSCLLLAFPSFFLYLLPLPATSSMLYICLSLSVSLVYIYPHI